METRTVRQICNDDDDELASLAHFWEVRRLSHFAKNMSFTKVKAIRVINEGLHANCPIGQTKKKDYKPIKGRVGHA